MSHAGAANGTVVDAIPLAPDLRVLRVRPDRVPPPSEPWFRAGQHVGLGVPSPDPGDATWLDRPLSIASEPEERRWLEFVVRGRGPAPERDGFVERLWRIGRGDRVRLASRIAGRLTVEDTVGCGDARLRLLVAAGTGVAPFASIVRGAGRREGGAGLERLALLHGARTARHLAFRDEVEGLLGGEGGRYVPTISRPGRDPTWTGARGRVETLLDDERLGDLERRLGLAESGLDPARAVVFVCGHRETIAGVVARLFRRGFVPCDRESREALEVSPGTPSSLFHEHYGTEAILDPGDSEFLDRLRAEYPGRI